MNDAFERKVRTAATATWQICLIAAGFLTLIWLIYLATINARVGWMLALWGPDVTWDFFQNVCLWVIVVLKFCVWLMALAALWLTLWARQLRKADRQ
jgi:hypothetical protein